MNKVSRLALCFLIIVIITIPLVDILSNVGDLNNICVLSLIFILMVLISLWICAAFWLFVEWHDSFN